MSRDGDIGQHVIPTCKSGLQESKRGTIFLSDIIIQIQRITQGRITGILLPIKN